MDQDSALRAKEIRDKYIPVPGKNEGYVKVLLLRPQVQVKLHYSGS
ncbi:MAG: hypothetical protein RQM92_11765 [Candidatus Syntrophopropionicum ammoniitolerans]